MRYYRPDSLEIYFKLRTTLAGKSVVVLAGGTDLMPRYERGLSMPDHLIDLKYLSQLSSIQVSENYIEIGALTSIQDLHDHAVIQKKFTAIHQAAHEFAGAQIRHRGTIGGNLCNASPAGDLLPALYAFGATLELTSKHGQRKLPVAEFILGPGKTALGDGEILTSIRLPRDHFDSKFIKVGLRQTMAISVINIAFVYSRHNHSYSHLKIAVGAVAPTIVILDTFTTDFLAEPSQLSNQLHLIDEAISPIDDIRATAKYRRTVLKNLIQDFLAR
ncbi:MAG: xanthine dehydrogenase family protein subunit M [Candidatus Marinimicrobia bacterium]|nr:xanthine dehydrogenase family protein subunit M [Candidatus Neomarinimicrobiota bacterium]